MNIQKLSAWIRRRKKGTDELRLMYLGDDDKSDVVETWLAEQYEGQNSDDIAKTVLETAQDDCNEKEVVSRYRLQAFIDGEPDAGITLKNRPSNRTDPLNVDDSMGSTYGEQLRRVSELQLRLQYQAMKELIDGYKGLLADQRQEILELRKREAKAADVIHSAAVEALEQENHPVMEKVDEYAKQIIPALVNNLASKGQGGNGGIPQS